MNDLSRDPIHNVIQNQVKHSIRVLIENSCWGAATILIYSGMDMMAYLSMPSYHKEVREKDFVAWADRYIRFPCKEQVTGLDFYGARCGLLHTYSPFSKKSQKGQCRVIAYGDTMVPEVVYNPGVDKNLVVVSVTGLAEAFFKGVDQSLIDLFSDSKKSEVTEARLQELAQIIPFNQQ